MSWVLPYFLLVMSSLSVEDLEIIIFFEKFSVRTVVAETLFETLESLIYMWFVWLCRGSYSFSYWTVRKWCSWVPYLNACNVPNSTLFNVCVLKGFLVLFMTHIHKNPSWTLNLAADQCPGALERWSLSVKDTPKMKEKKITFITQPRNHLYEYYYHTSDDFSFRNFY